jgi:RNA recognition motif-containing protein
MAKKLYVGNLPYNTNDDDLRELFSTYGEVTSSSVIIDRMTNRSKGFGFVEMTNNDEAQKAIDELNNTNFNDRNIRVNEALERKPRRDGGRDGGYDRY